MYKKEQLIFVLKQLRGLNGKCIFFELNIWRKPTYCQFFGPAPAVLFWCQKCFLTSLYEKSGKRLTFHIHHLIEKHLIFNISIDWNTIYKGSKPPTSTLITPNDKHWRGKHHVQLRIPYAYCIMQLLRNSFWFCFVISR